MVVAEIFVKKGKKFFLTRKNFYFWVEKRIMSAYRPYQITESLPVVNDPAAIYLRVTDTKPSYNYLKLFDELIGLSDIIVSNWLNITTRTLRNYRKTKDIQLKDNTKEHIITIMALYKHGIEVFDSKTDFEKWLTTKNLFLNDKAPMDFLDTISGIQLIDNRLTAMEFGENA